MKDVHEILEAWREESDPAQLVLATVVRGGHPGAHMLIRVPDCLDHDLGERAAEVLQTGRPRLVTYEGADVLLETMITGGEWLEFAEECLAKRVAGCVVTQWPEAARMFWTPSRSWTSGRLLAAVHERALDEAPEARANEVWEHALVEVIEVPQAGHALLAEVTRDLPAGQ